MKKNTKILIALVIGIILSGIILWNWKSPSSTLVSPTPTNMVDTTKYTDVVLINRTNDSVQVFVTLILTHLILTEHLYIVKVFFGLKKMWNIILETHLQYFQQ